MIELPEIGGNFAGMYSNLGEVCSILTPRSVLEFGTGFMISTRAFLASGVQRLVTVDRRDEPDNQKETLRAAYPRASIDFIQQDVKAWSPTEERFDLVFVDAHGEDDWMMDTAAQMDHVAALSPRYVIVDDCAVNEVARIAISRLGEPTGKTEGPTGIWWWVR